MIETPVAQQWIAGWTAQVYPTLLFPASWTSLVYLLELSLFRGATGTYLHCTADPATLWHRNTHRGLGDRIRTTCIPLVHYTFLYKFCQMCAVRKLGGEEKEDSESKSQPHGM